MALGLRTRDAVPCFVFGQYSVGRAVKRTRETGRHHVQYFTLLQGKCFVVSRGEGGDWYCVDRVCTQALTDGERGMVLYVTNPVWDARQVSTRWRGGSD